MTIALQKPKRRPRFRRAAAPPAFRLTDGDVEIIRQLARHRFLRSTHIASLVGRSLDRTNDRLCRLFHAGYIDRPRAQLDYYPTTGSAPMAYALADRGVRLLNEHYGAEIANPEWSRKNRQAGRPFIEHRLEVMDFYVALQAAAHDRDDIQLIPPEEIVAAFPEKARTARNPLCLRVELGHNGAQHEFGIIPDLVFGLKFADGSRRCFMVEIDRGTMPITRSDIRQTSFERKLRGYLTAHAAGQHQRQFGANVSRAYDHAGPASDAVDDGRNSKTTNPTQPWRFPILIRDPGRCQQKRSDGAWLERRAWPRRTVGLTSRTIGTLPKMAGKRSLSPSKTTTTPVRFRWAPPLSRSWGADETRLRSRYARGPPGADAVGRA